MTTKSAIQAMLDGKKITCKEWDEEEYIYLDGDYFRDESALPVNVCTLFPYPKHNWEIYEVPKPKQTVVIEKWLVKTAFNLGLKVIEASVEFIKSHYSDVDKVKLLNTYEVEL